MENKPILRFQEYKDSWKSIELERVISSLKSGLSRMLSNEDIGLPVVRANNISEGVLDLENDVKYWYSKDPQGAKTSNYYISINDILINFINSEAKMGTAAFVEDEPKRPTIYTTNIMNLRINERADPYFIYMLTNTNHYKNYIKLITKPAVNQASFTTVDFKKFIFNIPRIEEQREISSFFRKLEKNIVCHQQELDNLKETKQGFLQKMFPKDGETLPEVRFAGFGEEWKKIKLGDYAEILTGGTPKTQIKEYWTPKEIPWMSSGEVNKKRIFSTTNMISENGLENSSARWIPKHSILIALAGQGKTRGTVAINEIPLTTNQSIAAIVPNKDLIHEFVYQNFEKRYEELRLMSSGDGSRGGLNKQIIADIIVPLPSVEEQLKIGEFLKRLDQTIELHEKELEALKETKKAFLQKMFV